MATHQALICEEIPKVPTLALLRVKVEDLQFYT